MKNIKKALLTTVAATAFSSSAMAHDVDTFYLKGNVGAQALEDVKVLEGLKKLKHDTNAFIDVGVGYYLMDNVRTDLTFSYYFNPEFSKSDTEDGDRIKTKAEGKVYSLLLNGYVDLFDISVAKIYSGVGVGYASIKPKIKASGTDDGKQFAESFSVGKKNNFAYALYLGTKTEITPGIHLGVEYSWRDFGGTKRKNVIDSDGDSGIIKAHKYRGHHVAGGVTIDL